MPSRINKSLLQTLRVGCILLCLGLLLAWVPLRAQDPQPLLQEGFETMEAGTTLPVDGSTTEWSTPAGRLATAVVVHSATASEGKQFLQVISHGEAIDEDHAAHLKIEPDAKESSIAHALDISDPSSLNGKTLRFTAKARGHGFLSFYYYQTAASGGLPNNPSSPCFPVQNEWEEYEWIYTADLVPETEGVMAAVHFFTYDSEGIELDDIRVEIVDP